MQITNLTIGVLFLFFLGVAFYLLLDRLTTVLWKKNSLLSLLWCVIATPACYLLACIIAAFFEVFVEIDIGFNFIDQLNGSHVSIAPKEIGIATFASFLLAPGVAAIYNMKILHRLGTILV